MDGLPRGARALATLTFAIALVGCAGGSGQSATPTLATPGPTATMKPSATAEPPVPTPTPVPTAALGRLGAEWRAVTTTPSDWRSYVIAVTPGGPGWIALRSPVGSAPVEWRSADGFSWVQGATLPLPGGLSGEEMAGIASFGTDVYGLGIAAFDDSATGYHASAVVWRSRNGGAWEVIGARAPFDLGPCPEGCPSVSSIAAGAAGVVVAGYRLRPVGERFELETVLWSTLDGTTWASTVAPVPEGSSDQPAAEIAVAAGGPGFVAAGSLCDASGRVCRAVTWASADGRTWAAPTDLPGGAGVRAQQLAIGPTGAAVLGMRCTEEAGCAMVAWGSADGVAWEPADLTGTYREGSTQLALAGDTFLLVTSTDEADCGVWASTDGRRWASADVEHGLVPARPIGQVLGLAGRPGSALAVGFVSGGEEELVGFWVSP